MSFLVNIRQYLYSIASFFYNVAATTGGWVWPFSGVSSLFYSVGRGIDSITWEVYLFDVWLQGVQTQLAQVISWSSLTSWFNQYLGWLVTAYNWVINSWTYVQQILGSWWAATSTTVLGWIAAATQGLAEVRTWWANFSTTVLPNLVSFAWLGTWWAGQLPGIQALIYSTLRSAFPFYDELSQLWSGIRAFFVDPLQWVYDQLDTFFERFW